MEYSLIKKSISYSFMIIPSLLFYILFFPILSLLIPLSSSNFIVFCAAFLASVAVYSSAKLFELILYRENGFKIEADFSYFTILYLIACSLFSFVMLICVSLKVPSFLISVAAIILIYVAAFFIIKPIEKKANLALCVPFRIIMVPCALFFSAISFFLVPMANSTDNTTAWLAPIVALVFLSISLFAIGIKYMIFGGKIIVKKLRQKLKK